METAGTNFATDAKQATEAMEQFLEEATPKILEDLKELHKERYGVGRAMGLVGRWGWRRVPTFRVHGGAEV